MEHYVIILQMDSLSKYLEVMDLLVLSSQAVKRSHNSNFSHLTRY